MTWDEYKTAAAQAIIAVSMEKQRTQLYARSEFLRNSARKTKLYPGVQAAVESACSEFIRRSHVSELLFGRGRLLFLVFLRAASHVFGADVFYVSRDPPVVAL